MLACCKVDADKAWRGRAYARIGAASGLNHGSRPWLRFADRVLRNRKGEPGDPGLAPMAAYGVTGRSERRLPGSRIVLPQGEPGGEQAVLVGDAVAAAQGQVLGEDREVGQLVRVDELGELGAAWPAAAGRRALEGPSRTGRS